MTLSPQWLDQLRDRTTLSTLVMKTVPLKRKGKEWTACCPFHSENTPSFYVNDEKGFAHCFGCGAHVDAIGWLTDNQGMDFMDAVKELAAAAGMEVPARDPNQSSRDRDLDEGRELVRRAGGWFRDNLRAAAPAQDYLTSRGITPAVAEEFGIGWAGSGSTALTTHMAQVEPEKMIRFGLLTKRDDKPDAFDFFRSRVMIPIHDARGRMIGFGGRALGDVKPKYLNSPDTPIFDKGRVLFNLHRAAPAARKADRLIVVEGYMDVIALHRAGIPESVAPNGTAITEAQIQLAWRHADEPIFCMDGDKAGKAAMARAAIKALPILEPGKSLRFVSPPEGQDPDDILREKGAEVVKALFAKPRALVDVLWAHERDSQPAETPEQIAGFKNRMRVHIRSIKNADVREAYGQAIAKRFREQYDAVSEGVLRSSPLPDQRPRTFQNKPAPASREQQQIRRSGIALDVERAMLAGLVRYPEIAGGEIASCAKFRDPDVSRMVGIIITHLWDHPCTEEQLREHLDGQGVTDRLAAMTRDVPPFIFTRNVHPDRKDEAKRLLTEMLLKLS